MARAILTEEASPNVGNNRGFVRETPNINANFVELYGGGPILTLTAARTLLASESGAIVVLHSATGFAVTLPTIAANLCYKFFMRTAVTTTAGHTVVGGAGTIVGGVYTNDFSGTTDSDFEATGGATITFVINKAVRGDWAEIFSDGTFWYMRAGCSVFDAITIT